ncbi:unnamed protein product [Moneuplotes crassus]|uniref:Mediator of RNA polymerase II transcription subunit 20 n=1 Tax=Euplotes crassus TaxID=5936 RepID=A0AAD1XY01_EUPCR|nr:unnamed protein product [Moneuplotes crassus]
MGYTITYRIDSTIEEIEEKIIALEGEHICKLEVDLHMYYHKTVSSDMKIAVSEYYERCFFIHEKEEEETFCAFSYSKEKSFCDSFETEADFKSYLDHSGVYDYKSSIPIIGNVWRMGDFVIRLGLITIGLTSKHILIQVEYGVLSTYKATVFIEDFLKQLLTDEGVKKIISLKTDINDFFPDKKEEKSMMPHFRLRQYCLPIIEDLS